MTKKPLDADIFGATDADMAMEELAVEKYGFDGKKVKGSKSLIIGDVKDLF